MKKQRYTNQGTNPARGQKRSIGNIRGAKASNELQNSKDVFFARQKQKIETIEQLKATRDGYIVFAEEIKKSLTKFEKAVQLAGESKEFQMFVRAVQAYHFAESEVVALLKQQQEELQKTGSRNLPVERQKYYEKELREKRKKLDEAKETLDMETRNLNKALNKLSKDSKAKKQIEEAKIEVERMNGLLYNVDSVLVQLQEIIAVSTKDKSKKIMFATSEELQNHAEAIEAKVETLETAENAQKRAEAIEAKVETLETAENAQKRAEAIEAKVETLETAENAQKRAEAIEAKVETLETAENAQKRAEAIEAKVETLETAENAQKRAEAIEAKVEALETAENAQKRAEVIEAKVDTLLTADEAEEQIAKLKADIVKISTQIEKGLEMIDALNKAAVEGKEAIVRVEASLADMRRDWDTSLSALHSKVDKLDENYKELARNITDRFTDLTATHHSDLEEIKREISTQSSSIKKGIIASSVVLGSLLAVVGGVALADYVKDSTSNVIINNNQGYTNVNVGDYKTITDINTAIEQLEAKLENTDDDSIVEKMEADITALENKLNTINQTTGWSTDENDLNNYLTGQPYDANGYNKNGEYVGQKESYTSISRDTYTKLNTLQAELNRLNGLQLDKYSEEAQKQIQADKAWLSSKIQIIDASTGWSTDANDMNNYLTGTIYDREGYDKDGYNKQGYDRDGFAKDGFNSQGYDVEGYDREGYDKDGFNREGYDKEGYDREGYNKEGYNREGYDKEGFNREGYDKEGFDREGYDKEGYDREGYDKEGFDREGYDKEGFNREGYDKEGYDREGYNKEGYDREGYDRDGWNIDGIHKETGTKYDPEGYDCEGYDKYGYDRNGNSIEDNQNDADQNGNVSSDDAVDVNDKGPGFGMGF